MSEQVFNQEVIAPPKMSATITLVDSINAAGELVTTINITLSEPVAIAAYDGDSPTINAVKDFLNLAFVTDPETFRRTFRAE